METETPQKRELISMGTKIGAVLGGIAFIIFGLLPGFYFGSYTALVIASKLAGGPVSATLLIKVMVAIGAMMGILCAAALLIVVGSLAGSVIGYVLTYFSKNGKK